MENLERAIADAEAVLWRLQEALREQDAPLLREVLREMVERIELRWDHVQKWGRTYCSLNGGTVWMRSHEGISKSYPSAARPRW